MTDNDDLGFYRKRAREERAAAAFANEANVASTHSAMAFLYENLIKSLTPKREPSDSE